MCENSCSVRRNSFSFTLCGVDEVLAYGAEHINYNETKNSNNGNIRVIIKTQIKLISLSDGTLFCFLWEHEAVFMASNLLQAQS